MDAGALTLLAVGTIVVPAALVAVLAAGERGVRVLPVRARAGVTPWLWLAPALLLLGAVLVYPALRTVVASFTSADGSSFVGLENFRWAFSDDSILQVLSNNALWLLLFPVLSVLVALVVALLTDGVRGERFARSAFVFPTAISFAVTGVIWQLMYQYAPAGQPQRGTINGAVTALGGDPRAWVTDPSTSNLALIIAGVWAHVGLATIILSGAVKAIPRELIEAARMDGAGTFQVITRVMVPVLWPTILVVTTTQVIYALKVFDIVYVMTNGNFDTDVIANNVYSQLFVAQDFGHASALSLILFVLASPIIAFNVRQFRNEEALR